MCTYSIVQWSSCFCFNRKIWVHILFVEVFFFFYWQILIVNFISRRNETHNLSLLSFVLNYLTNLISSICQSCGWDSLERMNLMYYSFVLWNNKEFLLYADVLGALLFIWQPKGDLWIASGNYWHGVQIAFNVMPLGTVYYLLITIQTKINHLTLNLTLVLVEHPLVFLFIDWV